MLLHCHHLTPSRAASLSRPKSESNVGALLSPKHAHTAVRRDDRPVAAAAAAKPRSPVVGHKEIGGGARC